MCDITDQSEADQWEDFVCVTNQKARKSHLKVANLGLTSGLMDWQEEHNFIDPGLSSLSLSLPPYCQLLWPTIFPPDTSYYRAQRGLMVWELRPLLLQQLDLNYFTESKIDTFHLFPLKMLIVMFSAL